MTIILCQLTLVGSGNDFIIPVSPLESRNVNKVEGLCFEWITVSIHYRKPSEGGYKMGNCTSMSELLAISVEKKKKCRKQNISA